MSCIPTIGHDRWVDDGGTLPRSSPEWSLSKMERLHAMAISEDPGRRAIAANHPNVEPNDLDRLMHDPIVAVRVAAVKNFAMPQGWLYMLMRHDPDEGVRAYAKMRLGGDKWDS